MTEFRCDNGECIDNELVCDGLNATDCIDGSDESVTTCGKTASDFLISKYLSHEATVLTFECYE
jgi:hypothetical protein